MPTYKDMLAIFSLAGGLALFLYGLSRMVDGLRGAAGAGLQRMVRRAGRRPSSGFALGASAGALIHTGGALALLVQLTHAGLLSLDAAMPALLGANAGATLAIQLIALPLGDYGLAAIAVGLLLQSLGGGDRGYAAGRAVAGLGFLFLGMSVMGGALRPYHEILAPWLARLDGTTPMGLLAGFAISAALAALMQSSGAVLGLVFALAASGVLTRFDQALPVILGANVGHCSAALVAALGTNAEARRVAAAHLLFNVAVAIAGALLSPALIALAPHLSDDPVRRIAHTNLLLVTAAAFAVLPLRGHLARLAGRVVPVRGAPPEAGHLDPMLVATPEDALAAAIRELRRAAGLCLDSFRMDAEILLRRRRRLTRRIERNEAAMDRIKRALRDYLHDLTGRYLSRRQALLLPALDRAVTALERVHDHIRVVTLLSHARLDRPAARFREDDLAALFALRRDVERVLETLTHSLGGYPGDFGIRARDVLSAGEDFRARQTEILARFMRRVEEHEYLPESAIYFEEYVEAFARIVRHARAVAGIELQPEFHIEIRKLGRVAPPPPDFIPPPLVDVDEFLRKHGGGADSRRPPSGGGLQ